MIKTALVIIFGGIFLFQFKNGYKDFLAQGAIPVSLTPVGKGKNLQTEKFQYFLLFSVVELT